MNCEGKKGASPFAFNGFRGQTGTRDAVCPKAEWTSWNIAAFPGNQKWGWRSGHIALISGHPTRATILSLPNLGLAESSDILKESGRDEAVHFAMVAPDLHVTDLPLLAPEYVRKRVRDKRNSRGDLNADPQRPWRLATAAGEPRLEPLVQRPEPSLRG
jgi:hypothetical protein